MFKNVTLEGTREYTGREIKTLGICCSKIKLRQIKTDKAVIKDN